MLNTSGLATLRAPFPTEADSIQAIWEASYAHDDPGGFARGGWSVGAWATDVRVLVVDQHLVGLTAVRAEAAPDQSMAARLALILEARQPALAEMLVGAVLDLVSAAGGSLARLFLPDRAKWAIQATEATGFRPVRTMAHMLLPAATPTPTVAPIPDLIVRAMRDGEEGLVLDALNRAWAGTWNFVSISSEMLAEDLHGQRQGMLLGVTPDDRIVATCHAVFEAGSQNPDGNPRAWISNLTVDPAERGRGVARAMLGVGIAHLRARGGASIALGVDADDPAPFGLYRSVGFQIVTQMLAWDRAVD